MKPEPLNGKVCMMKTGHNQKFKVKAVRLEYIKSAVEWLKEQIHGNNKEIISYDKTWGYFDESKIKKLIDKAFSDEKDKGA